MNHEVLKTIMHTGQDIPNFPAHTHSQYCT